MIAVSCRSTLRIGFISSICPLHRVSPDWDRLPSRVERNFMRLLDLAAEHRVRCTCFFLGWVAHRHPGLVKAAIRRGHEIASHGWAHRLAYQLTPKEFYEDAAKAKDVLEQISGSSVLGYRSAGFSLSNRNPWVFDELLRAEYLTTLRYFPPAMDMVDGATGTTLHIW